MSLSNFNPSNQLTEQDLPNRGDGLARELAFERERTQIAERQSALLATVVAVSETLLKAQSLAEVIDEVLAQMGKALHADRCGMAFYLAPDEYDALGYLDLRYEWVGVGIVRQMHNPALCRISLSQHAELISPLFAGIPVPILTQDIADDKGREEQELAGAQSQFLYPVMVDGKLWGMFGTDDCHAPRTWSPTEIDSLRLVASALSSVVKREQLVEARIAAEREQVQEAKRQSELLAAVVTTSEFLLKSQSLAEVINEVLAQMGKALAVDRCAMGICLAPDEHDALGYLELKHEWVSAGIARQTDNPALSRLPFSQYLDLVTPLFAGMPISILTQDIANDQAREEQELTGAQSQFNYPIMVDGKLWGMFGVDDCRTPRVWSPSEIDSLRLVASAVASVVKREQLVEARIAAEREQVQAAKRQSELLAAVVTTSEFLLKSSSLIDAVDQVLAQMGAALKADRCLIGVKLPPDDKDAYGYMDFQHEWVAAGIFRQTDNPDLKIFASSHYIELENALNAGTAMQILTDDFQSDVSTQHQELASTKSQFIYPIMVDGKPWGTFAADDCHQRRIWSPEEIDSLRLVASAVASVVKREQLVEARIAAEREQVLAAKRHAELLAAVVTTSELLLKSPALTDAIDKVLVQMGTALQADRCLLGVYLQPDANDAFGYFDFQHEWVNFGIARQTDKPELKVFGMSKYQEFIKPLLEGIAIPVITEEIENSVAQQEQELTGSKSQFVYPIMVDGKLWGVFDVDDCHAPRIWSPTEIDSLRLVASALSSVVKREQLVEARIAAERERESARQAGEIAVTQERNRIARDIHDTLAQGFTGVIMQAQAAEDALLKQDAPAVLHHMGRAQHIAKASLHDARRSVFALRPSVLIGQTLAQALKAQLERMAVDSLAQATFETSGEPAEPSNLVATELLRIAQEATNNVLRHAAAGKITLCLRWHAGSVELMIKDNGRGFDVTQQHVGFGMISMRERADRMQAVLSVESSLGQGTLVSVSVDPQAGVGPEKLAALKLTA